MSFDNALREVIGGRLKVDRYYIWRQWTRAKLLQSLQQTSGTAHMVFDDENRGSIVYSITELPADKDTTNELFNHFKESGIAPEVFALMQKEIPEWRRQQQARQRAEAAKARWRKEKPRSKKLPIDTIRKRRK